MNTKYPILARDLTPYFWHNNMDARILRAKNDDGRGRTWWIEYEDGYRRNTHQDADTREHDSKKRAVATVCGTVFVKSASNARAIYDVFQD